MSHPNDASHPELVPSLPLWQTNSSRIIAENRILRLESHERHEPGTGRNGTFYIVNAPNWVNIIALTERDEILLIEQFRHGSGAIELEIPGGTVDEGESAHDAMLRELTEETGYELGPNSIYQQIGEVAPNPAFIQNRCTTFLATNIRPTGTTAFGEHENIRIRLHPRSELDQLLRTGEISHALVIAAIQWMRLAGY